MPSNTSLIAGALSYFFTTPPTPTTDLYGYMLGFNLDTDAAKIFATSAAFTQSASDVVDAKSDNVDAFRARGGKILFYHGGSDPIFSYRDTIAYQNRLVTRYGDAATANFSRLFLIPGMNHCSGGPATDKFDGLAALVDWVENGHAPDSMLATARATADVAWPNRTRPLCPYPKQARYKGTGSIEDAANFTCQVPAN
jgi:feruloyl esterase